MRVILDTNVLVSGVFFGGPPARVLEAWRDGVITPVLSAEIFAEYRRVAEILSSDHPDVDLAPILAVLAIHSEFVEAPPLPQSVAADPADDKFLACAVAGRVEMIISGDKHLLRVSGWQGVQVVTPRRFFDEHLESSGGTAHE